MPYHSVWQRLPVKRISTDAAKFACTSHRGESQIPAGWRLAHPHIGQAVVALNLGIHEKAKTDTDYFRIWRLEGEDGGTSSCG